MNDLFDSDKPREYPLGSCIHCGLNVWRADILGWYVEDNVWKAICQCAHCKQIVISEELIPF